MGVSNFDPHKFNGLNKAVNGQLVTNQIEWNPVCFEHFNSGMMDDPSAIIYAWIMYHPAGAVPISGSNRLDRLDTAIKALDIRLEHYEWYEIYKASGQQAIR